MFPAYIDSLKLKTPDGTLLTGSNYLSFIKKEIIRAAQIAKNAGATLPDTVGFVFSQSSMAAMPPLNGGITGAKPLLKKAAMPMMKKEVGEYVVDLDMPTYLDYVTTMQELKSVPAFDALGVAGDEATGENGEFGDEKGSDVNFTDYSAAKNGKKVSEETRQNAYLLNPMNFIGDGMTDVAPHWYIRHGARDRDTAFPIALNLAMKLMNNGKDVNYLLAWNRPHSGDYSLDELFSWIKSITQK